MDRMLSVFKALSDRNRLRVVGSLLIYDELCACQLTELLAVTGATASRHCSVLVSAGILASRKEGRWVYYRLCRDDVTIAPVLEWIERELKSDSDALLDRKRLAEIAAGDREELCRRQRGEACCPASS